MDGPQELEPTSKLISQIEPIEEMRGCLIGSRDKIQEYVEPPLVSACEELYDKNIETLASSANKKDVGREAYILINFGSLSPKNQAIAKELVDEISTEDKRQTFLLKVPIKDENVTVGEIKAEMARLVSRFEKQPMTWTPTFTIEYLRQVYGFDPKDETYGVDTFLELGLYYDALNKVFYCSEEHYRKATEKVTSAS